MKKYVALIADRYTSESVELLRGLLDVEIRISLDEPELNVSDVDLLLIRSRTKVTENYLAKFNNLKLIISATSGFDHIDLNACAKRNIHVAHTPEANAQSAAEHSLLLMLASLKNFRKAQAAIESNQWKTHLAPGHELQKRKVGLVGLGRVGSRVARMVKAFGAEVAAYDPYIDDDRYENMGVHRFGLTELIKFSDVISLHVPLTKETRHFFRKSIFEEMNTNTILVNTSRGEVINEDDLSDALQCGHIAGAALDVFEREPLTKDTRILKSPLVITTPHIGAHTEEALNRASRMAVENAVNFFRSGVLEDELTKLNEGNA